MTAFADFEQQLRTNSKPLFGKWRKIDLHNHSPVSQDYEDNGLDVEDKLVERIHTLNLEVVMFTDHNDLPDPTLVDRIAKRTSALILQGVEMNIFVEAHGKPDDKIDTDSYYHFLIGFDPNAAQKPSFWLEYLKKECFYEIKNRNGLNIGGLTARIDAVIDILKEANAICIPAHLHDQKGAFRARSIDEVYSDKSFLKFAREFTALEVTNTSTADFFDGKHIETDNLFKNCIRSSDSHSPAKLGWRVSWAKMETLTFDELKAALELPGRIRISEPETPPSWIEAIHVEGSFLKDTWLQFSPDCNMFIAIKGSGKTSVLECLRFALNLNPPQSKINQVSGHLTHILGESGRVRVMLRRADGSRILLERRRNDAHSILHQTDGSFLLVERSQTLGFHAQILGWNEIEDAANDPTTRRKYLDEIAGSEQISEFDSKIESLRTQLQNLHNTAHVEFKGYQQLRRKVLELQLKQQRLKEVRDTQIIELLEQYQNVAAQVTSLETTINSLEGADQKIILNARDIYPRSNIEPLRTLSPISESLSSMLDLFQSLNTALDEKSLESAKTITIIRQLLAEKLQSVYQAKQSFDQHFDREKIKLNPEQRQILEQHRIIASETSELPGLSSQLESHQVSLKIKLSQLSEVSTLLADVIEQRTNLRQQAVDKLSHKLSNDGVKLQLLPRQLHEYSLLSQNRVEASQRFQTSVIQKSNDIWQRTLASYYFNTRNIESNTEFYDAAKDLLDHRDLHEFVYLTQDDDLRIQFEPHKGAGFKEITNLSAGQRCTAMFPILLNVGTGPLMIDQPEDNLDNRYISEVIAPALVREKGQRQLVFTSHNANLVVLSDSENIVAFESDGQYGTIARQGFLSTPRSQIKEDVLGILDGGLRALQQRTRKYGS